MSNDTKINDTEYSFQTQQENNCTDKEKVKKKFSVGYFLFQSVTILFPIIWFSWLYPDFKYKWHLVQETTNSTTVKGWIINILIALIVLVAIIINSRKNNNNETISMLINKYKDALLNIAYYNNERKYVKQTCAIKVKTLLNVVKELKSDNDKTSIPRIISNPNQQLDSLISQLGNTFCGLVGININDCNINAAYRFDIDNEWKWFENYTPSEGEDIKLLTSQLSSTFSKVVSMKGTHFICHTSKKEAFKAQEYFIEKPKFINEGILVAKHYFVGLNGKPFAEAVSSIPLSTSE